MPPLVHPVLRLILVKANRALPPSGSREEHLTFLSSLRKTRDAYSQRQSSISHDRHIAHEVARFQDLRLTHATNTLNAIEDIIGEARARFRARGIPLHSPPTRHQISSTVSVETPSGKCGVHATSGTSGTVILSNSNTAEEVSVLCLFQIYTPLRYHRSQVFSQVFVEAVNLRRG